MPPRGVKGDQASEAVRAHQGKPARPRQQRGTRGGDRRSHGQQGEGTRRRVPYPFANLDRGHVLGAAGGQRSGTNRQKGRTRDQLYNEARNLGIEGRSSMNKAQLQRAVDARK